MTNINVCDRTQAACLMTEMSWVAISISSSASQPLEFDIGEKDGPLAVLPLVFDDVTRLSPGLVAFNEDMASKIWDFVEQHWGKVEFLVIHCDMGMSRSPGVAAAIAKVKEGDDSHWFKTKTPNDRVFRGLLSLAHKRGLYDPFKDEE